MGCPHGEGLGLVEAGLAVKAATPLQGHLVSALEAGLARGTASAGAGQRRHVLSGPPERDDDAVVGGGHQDDRQQEEDQHLVRGHRYAPRGGRCLAARSKLKSDLHSIALFK